LDHNLKLVSTQSQSSEITRVISSSNNKYKLTHKHVMKAYFNR